jgi:hypothetical protein
MWDFRFFDFLFWGCAPWVVNRNFCIFLQCFPETSLFILEGVPAGSKSRIRSLLQDPSEAVRFGACSALGGIQAHLMPLSKLSVRWFLYFNDCSALQAEDCAEDLKEKLSVLVLVEHDHLSQVGCDWEWSLCLAIENGKA